MTLKRTTIIFVGGAALAAWFSAAMTPGRAPVVSDAIRPAPVDATGAALATEISRLRERLRPDVTPRDATRNPFIFRATPRAGSGRSVAAAAALESPSIAAAAEPTRLRLTLAGIAEDSGPGGNGRDGGDAGNAGGAPLRTAIIAGNGQLFLAREGDRVTDRDVEYRVGQISADSVELTSLRDSTIHRLALK